MEKINLLDCTLRDGGYINDWRFGENAIVDIKKKLEESNVDILELGFLKNEPYQKDRTVFNSMKQVKSLIGAKKQGVQYAVMCEVVNPLPLDMLEPSDEDSADIIRVIVWKTKHDKEGKIVDALEEGYKYCKGIVEKGYKLCVQPARVDQYSDEEFVSMVHRFSKLNPMAVYVVDSWGTQNAEELLHYMHLADEIMPADILLGYHGHNNMMQALGVSQAIIKEGFSRNLVIDASVYGIGRGAGNLNLEIIAKYLNEYCGKNYYISPILDVNDRYIQEIYQKEQWGYSIPYYLTAKYKCNPNYATVLQGKVSSFKIESFIQTLSEEERTIFSKKKVESMYGDKFACNVANTSEYNLTERIKLNLLNQEQLYEYYLQKYNWADDYVNYYLNICYAIHDSIEPILNSVPEEDQSRFSFEKGYKYLKKYESREISIATIIPTCNRPDAIQYLLDYTAPLHRRLGVDLIIYDSSTDMKTEEIVKEKQTYGFSNLIYRRYSGTFDGFSLDQKLIDAYLEFADEYDYIWICRDGLVPIVDEIIEKIRFYARKNVECFIVDTKARVRGQEIIKEYTTIENCEELLVDQAQRLQTLGMLILSSNLARRMIETVPNNEKTYSLWQMSAPFHLFAKEPYKIVFMTKNVFAQNTSATATHFWSKAEKALEQWARRWTMIIEGMPEEYNKAKQHCAMVYTVDFHPFKFRTILQMRGWGGLNYKIVKKYEKYIVKTTNTPLWCFKAISIAPKFLARMGDALIDRYPRLTKKIRKVVLKE